MINQIIVTKPCNWKILYLSLEIIAILILRNLGMPKIADIVILLTENRLPFIIIFRFCTLLPYRESFLKAMASPSTNWKSREPFLFFLKKLLWTMLKISTIAHKMPSIYLINYWSLPCIILHLLWFEVIELEAWLHLYCYWVGNYLVSVIRFRAW